MHKPKLVAPNIYLLPALKPSAHCYLIRGEKNTLIDTSIKDYRDHIVQQLASLELTLDDIDDVIYTHCHHDHTGGGELFPKATIYAHPLCAFKLRYQDENCIHSLKYQLPLPAHLPDKLLEEGDTYTNGDYSFTVIHTPGHTDDSICLLEKNHKILFSADTVFVKGIPPLITDSGSIGSLIYSIEKLQQYDIELILPGHGPLEKNVVECLIKLKENLIKKIAQDNKKTIEEAKKWQKSRY